MSVSLHRVRRRRAKRNKKMCVIFSIVIYTRNYDVVRMEVEIDFRPKVRYFIRDLEEAAGRRFCLEIF